MGSRSVFLDEDTEKALARLAEVTGLSISEILKRGVFAYWEQILAQRARRPYEVYRRLALGSGGYTIAPAEQAKSAVVDVIEAKHDR